MHAVRAVPVDLLPATLSDQGWAVVAPEALATWLDIGLDRLTALEGSWNDLPPDTYLRDGGHYRFRRHACYIVEPAKERRAAAVTRVAHRPHWQPVTYNALHGGIERWFEPIDAQVSDHPAWQALLHGLGTAFSQVKPVHRWHVEAHQFRVDTSGGIGRPTPEGAHRDGVDFVAVIMVGRQDVKGGETRVFEADGPHGVRFTLDEPWCLLALDDARVIHESTPIQPLGERGWRDTLVLTYRASGFQGPDQA